MITKPGVAKEHERIKRFASCGRHAPCFTCSFIKAAEDGNPKNIIAKT
jgi:hypothetical protein